MQSMNAANRFLLLCILLRAEVELTEATGSNNSRYATADPQKEAHNAVQV